MDKLTKDRAIFYNIVLPGWGDVYIEKNHSTISILVIGIITSLLGLYSFYDLCNYFGFFSVGNALQPIFRLKLDYLLEGANESFLNHYIFIGYTFILPRILFAFMINDRWKKYQNKITKENISNSIKSDSENFILEITKIYDLKTTGIYSEETYSQRKADVISKLIKSGISEKLEDFLVKLIPLKDKGILKLDDINFIKSSLS